MESTEFNELRKELVKKAFAIQEAKGKDYTKGNADILKAFKDGGDSFGVDAHKYLGFGLYKQINAIYSYIKTDGQSESEPIDMRICDAINYLIFLHALNIENDKISNIKS